jgi:rhodanese-related sulfurtransferase
METPGHTPDSVCYLFQGIAFTGDTLMIGALGRTDFPGSSPSQLFHSLHQKIRKLPASTLVMPGHDYNDLICSTIEAEFKASPQLQIQSDAEFDAFKKSEVVAVTNSEVLACIEYNLAASPAKAEPTPVGAMATAVCGKASSEATVFSSINVDKYSHKLIENIEGHLFVDVRERDEFEEGHMPGAKNIPLSEIGFHLSEFQKATRIYFSCLSGRRSSFAAKTLCRLGLNDVVNVTGGIKAWVQAGLPVKQGR